MKGNQAKRPGVCLYSGGGFVCIREKGKKEGRAWNKCQDAQLSWPCCVVLGMFITVFSLVTSFFYPINLAKLLV